MAESAGNPAKYFEWVQRWLRLTEEPENPEQRYHRPGRIRRLILLLLPGRVSRIHLYEAQERYLMLLRMLEFHSKIPCNDTNGKAQEERRVVIDMCRRVLRDASVLLTRRQADLNYLWRELTRVHIAIVEKILPETLLPTQLDFCREEAARIRAQDHPEISEMIQRLAEVTQEQDIRTSKERMMRAIRALIERFTTIRTGRIHQQFVNIRTYRVALVILLSISIILIGNADLFVRKAAPPGEVSKPPITEPQMPSRPSLLSSPAGYVAYVARVIRQLLQKNILFFVFLAGLTGGFFSVVIRLRDRELVPGEDAYFVWYVLSKPFVGALGAVILFILLQGGLISLEILERLTETLNRSEPGPVVFGFSFLAGFTERIVFPHFR
jgi:hypothetical protein